MKKILVIGQGIAGTLLAWTLEKRGAAVTVADAGLPNSASAAAAGILNPVTGKRYAKSWMVDELLPFAEKTYREMEVETGLSFFHKRPIIRLLGSPEEENNWAVRCAWPEFSAYIQPRNDGGQWSELLKPGFRFGEIRQAAQVDFWTLLAAFREKWQRGGQFLEKFIAPEMAENMARDFDHIVWCDGFRGRENPFFPGLPWEPAKGEALIIRLENPPGHRQGQISQMLKKKIMLTPLGGGLFWAGASNEWEFEDGKPTEAGKALIVNELESMLARPFEVVSHLAGIRPTVKDRRPLLGPSPVHPKMSIFNGMGTKAGMLGPFLAAAFSDFLLDGKPLPPAVDLKRFEILPLPKK